MCGFGNNMGAGTCGINNNPCTIILIIVIFKYLNLLDTECNPNSKNALTLLFLYWLCCNNGVNVNSFLGNNNGCCNNTQSNNCCCNSTPSNNCCCKKVKCCKPVKCCCC